eukprot:g6951.t1
MTAASKTLPIVAVGAHMRGLPLNYQLTERGATFVREAKTAEKYQLYAFESEKKPGLIQVTTDAAAGPATTAATSDPPPSNPLQQCFAGVESCLLPGGGSSNKLSSSSLPSGTSKPYQLTVEVWQMPIEKVGSFLALVPPPLCIGHIELEDGTVLHGFRTDEFMVRAKGAKHISEFGGWRGYLKSMAPGL